MEQELFKLRGEVRKPRVKQSCQAVFRKFTSSRYHLANFTYVNALINKVMINAYK